MKTNYGITHDIRIAMQPDASLADTILGAHSLRLEENIEWRRVSFAFDDEPLPVLTVHGYIEADEAPTEAALQEMLEAIAWKLSCDIDDTVTITSEGDPEEFGLNEDAEVTTTEIFNLSVIREET